MDPRIVDAYTTSLSEQIKYHKLDEKIKTMFSKAQDGKWYGTDTATHKSMDKILTEAMLHSERTSTRKFSDTFTWSHLH
jgi:hypothetical protein